MERVHFDENENRRDCIGGKIKKEDHEMDKIRNNCHQSIIISLAAALDNHRKEIKSQCNWKCNREARGER